MRKISRITSPSAIAYRKLLRTDVRITSNIRGEPKRSAQGSKRSFNLLDQWVLSLDTTIQYPCNDFETQPDGRDSQVAFSKFALLHCLCSFNLHSEKHSCLSEVWILFVADLFHPVDRAAVQRLLNGDMHHRAPARRAVPVLLAGLKPHDVTGPDCLDRPAPTLHPSGARRHNQRLAERVRMPGGACWT